MKSAGDLVAGALLVLFIASLPLYILLFLEV